MNNKKGFTLVELIGIIIVLGLLVIIGVPSLLKTLKKSETNEYDVFKKNLYLSAEAYLASNIDNISNFSEVGDKVYIPLALLKEAELIESSLINPNSGKNVSMYELIEVTILEDGTYNYDFKYKYNNGTLVYFNPDTGKRCSAKDYENNLANYDTTNTLSDGTKSPTGLKSGCMKWFVFNDDVASDSLTMILDHNTSGNVAWSTNGSTMKEVVERLKLDTDSWSETITLNKKIDNFDYTGYKARLITADEVAKITGADQVLQWASDKLYSSTVTIGSNISDYYLDGSFSSDSIWKTRIVNATVKSKFAWLYDNMYGCTDYGCNVADNNSYQYGDVNSNKYGYIYGYWTSSLEQKNGLNYAWEIHRTSNVMLNATIDNNIVQGLRPVIEISKKVI